MDGSPYREAIETHLTEHVGPIPEVFHELVSDAVHVDVLPVPATAERPMHTLVTCGMSARPMTVPPGSGIPQLAELVIALPPDWPIDHESWHDERHFWPVRLLKVLARLPHMFDTHLGVGHTIPNGDPPEPYAPGTGLCCALIVPPLVSMPAGAEVLTVGGEQLRFYAVMALHRDEMELRLERGLEALLDRLEAAGVTELVEPGRPSSLERRKRFGLFQRRSD